jgi:hypothetical protein
MAQRIEGLGYEINPRHLDETRYPKERIREREWGFEIAGVSPDILGRYSTRTKQRDSAIAERLRRHPEEPITERIVDALVRESRKPKHAYREAEREEIRETQLARLTPSERIALRDLAARAYEESERVRVRMKIAQGEEHGPRYRPLTYGERVNL